MTTNSAPTAEAAPPPHEAVPARPPDCVFVVGPRGAGKTRWIQRRLLDLAAGHPDFRAAVLLAEEGRTRMERFALAHAGVAVRRLLLPCPCCPALAQLPTTVRDVVATSRAAALFIETPATAAPGLLAEFDRDPAWPRRLVVCLDAKWARLAERPDRPYFLSALLEKADEVIPPEPFPAGPSGHGAVAGLTLS